MKDFFFDYVFYRIGLVYFKWDRRSGSTAILGVSFIQALTLSDLFIFVVRQFYKRSELTEYIVYFKYGGVFLLLLLVVLNYRRYNNTLNLYRTRWKNESSSMRFWKGIAVVITCLIPLIVMVILGRTGLG